MKQEFFKNVPSEIVIDILSRLPVRTVISCKCVQKSWLHLVETREFVKSHSSKSSPGLIISENNARGELKNFKFFEFEDGFDDVEHHDLHYKLVTKFVHNNLGATTAVMSSADGLLLMCKLIASKAESVALYICNPITREYINLDCPPEFRSYYGGVSYGFGLSKMSSQYKVVGIFRDPKSNKRTSDVDCCVYTLGTGSWRSIAYRSLFDYRGASGVFANGNLHWLVSDISTKSFFQRISCFDLETEHFSTLSVPFPWNVDWDKRWGVNLFAWGDCLGLCDSNSDDEIVIWLMKEYGDEKSWTKEFVLSNSVKLEYDEEEYDEEFISTTAYPIKVFKDGDILILWNGHFIYYSSKTKTTHKVDILKRDYECEIRGMLHIPSFFSLKSLGLENVISF